MDTPVRELLIGEADVAVADDLSRALQAHGFKATTAYDLVKVRQLLEEGQFSVAFVSTSLFAEDRPDLFLALANGFPEVAVVAVTGEPAVEWVIAAIRSGARDFLVRPFGTVDLVDAIRRAESGMTEDAISERQTRARLFKAQLSGQLYA